MKKRNIFEKGFTLVELLIVIALIAILSVAVLATINPIEQSNKARDAKFKNDAAEVLSAYERYYTSVATYPWMGVTTDPVASIDTTVLYASDDAHFGIVPDAGDAGVTAGKLILASELKASFMGKEPFENDVTEEDTMYAYHNGATNSNYVCFHPKAAANRILTSGVSDFLKCIDIPNTTIIDFGEAFGSGGCTLDPDADWDSDPSATVANVICVPEGSIQ